MKAIRARLGLGVLALGLVLTPASLWAAQDYEFAEGLLKLDRSDFPTEEFVERLAAQWLQSAEKGVKLEGKLVKAMLCREQAKTASAEKRNALLQEADKLYKEFLAEGEGHRLKEKCEAEAAEIQLDFARALVKAASEEPAKGTEFRRKAAEIFARIADERKTEADALRPKVKEALKAIDKFFEDHPDSEMAPAGVIAPAQKALQAYVPKDKMYIIARAEQVDAYAETDPEKKAKADELIKYCQEQTDSEDIGRLEDVKAWYFFMQGRLHSMVLNEEKAGEAWTQALDIDISNLPKESRDALFDLKKYIYRDLVKMKLRAAEKNAAKYEDIINVVGNAKYDQNMKAFWDDPAGKDLLIDYAHAMTHKPEAGQYEFEQAIKELRKIVEKGPPWSNNAARKMAELISYARTKNVRPKLTAQEWYDTARGFFIEGQLAHRRFREVEKEGDAAKAKAHFEDAYNQYDQAVEFYRRAIGNARIPVLTTLAERLKVEPQAWFEMGLSYLKMEHYYESIIAYQALRTTFKEEFREKWMPDKKKDAAFYRNKEVLEALAKLDRVNDADPREDGILNATEKNIAYALKINSKVKTTFNRELRVRLYEQEGGLGMDDSTDVDYQAAKLSLDTGRDTYDMAKSLARQNKGKDAQTQFAKALEEYVKAGDRFAKIKPESKAYEVGLYQAATCYYLAQTLVSEKRVPLSEEELKAKLDELGNKAIEMYQKYETHVAKEPDQSEEGQARRKKLSYGVRLSRAAIAYNMKDWDNTIKYSDEYIAYEAANPPASGQPKAITCQFYKFQAFSHKAGEFGPPECDPWLEKGEELLDVLKEKDSYYVYALGNISARYNNAAARAKNANMAPEIVNKYNGKIAQYQALAVELKKEEDRTLDDYGRLLYLYNETKKHQAAADIADTMLGRFDPENKMARIGDEEWPALLEKMNGINKIEYFNHDLNLRDRAKKEHMVLLDYLYDTREGANNRENPERCPPHDKFEVDYQKALNQVELIKKEFPKAPTHNPAENRPDLLYLNQKTYLDAVGEEIEYRRRIIATRDLLSEIALKVATAKEAEGDKDTAMKYRSMAGVQLKILEDIYGNVPSMKLKRAEIHIANLEYDPALDILWKIKHDEPDRGSELYIKSSKRISEVYAMKGDWNAAVEYPQFMAGTAGIESNWVKKWWPDMKEFLDKCYASGAKRPEKVEPIADLPDNTMKTADEYALEELKATKKLVETNPKLDNPNFRWKYDFLEGKIAHFKEYGVLERVLLKHKGKETEKQVLTENFMNRYRVIKELVEVETDMWRTHNNFNDGITKYGGVDKVPEEIKTKYYGLQKKVEELRKKLEGIPEPKLQDDGGTPAPAPAPVEKPASKPADAPAEKAADAPAEAPEAK